MSSTRCADLSEAAGESLAATATTAHDWLLVEVRGTWPRDVSDHSGLAEEERAIASWLDATAPSSRLLFIRRPGRSRGARLVFVVRAIEQEAEVRRIELGQPGDLAGIDLSTAGDVVRGQLVLVCGHGTRDACCALRGSAVFGALSAQLAPDELWLSSHHGGHRFAANALVLPHGIHLGRLSSATAGPVVAQAVSGRIALEHYRGRTSYSPREQAAERAVRESAGLLSLAGVRLGDDDGSYVRLVGADGHEYRALVEEAAGPAVPASCGVEATAQRRFVARLV